MKLLRAVFMAIGAAVSVTSTVFAPGAIAQENFPNRPITFIVPFPPGGGNDTLGRVFAIAMEKVLGQTILVENRPGAGSTIGMDVVAKSKPDGYTLGVPAQASLTTAPLTLPNVPFDPLKDFTAVYNFGTVPVVVIVNAELGPKTLKELIDYAKTHPGKLNYSSAGSGTGSHFYGASFTGITGIAGETVHIPYQGGAEAAMAVAAGEVQFYVGGLSGTMTGAIDSGKVIGLALSGDKHVAQLPNVPTYAEAGLPEYSMMGWYGLVAPAGTPSEIVDKLNKAATEAAKTPEVMKVLEAQGLSPNEQAPADFQAEIVNDYAAAKKIIDAGLFKIE
jgi:tripartite-type tricarboxylate transporter receptor subunit TctC